MCERHVRHADELDFGAFDIELRSASLFAFGRHFIVRSVDRLRATKAFASLFTRPISDGTFVTLIAHEMKATDPARKAFARDGAVEELPTPRGRGVLALASEILATEGVDLLPKERTALVQRCGGDLLCIAQEARKLRAYGPTTSEQAGIVARIAFPNAEQTVYPFYDRLGERSLRGALSELANLRDDPVRLLAGATRHLARLTMVRLLIDRRASRQRMASLLGVPEWLLRRLVDQARTGQLDEWIAALRLGIQLDHQVKSGGIAGSDALYRLVCAITRPAATRARG